jgi:hypothetical protein
MGGYREQCIKAKAVRAGIIEPRPLATPSHKAKTVILESRPLDGSFAYARRNGEWRKWRAYASVREAEQARDNLARKYARLWEFRLKP